MLGLSMCIEASSSEGASLKAVPVLNAMYELLQIHKRNMCALEEMEKEQLKKLSTLEHIQISNSRLKASMYGTSINLTFYMCIHRFEMTCNYSQSQRVDGLNFFAFAFDIVSSC